MDITARQVSTAAWACIEFLPPKINANNDKLAISLNSRLGLY